MVDELPFVEVTILSHITKIDSFDIDPVLLVIKLRLFVFDIRWFPSMVGLVHRYHNRCFQDLL